MKHCNCKNNCNCNDNELLKLIAIDIAKLKNIIDDILDSDRKVYWNSIINKPDVFPPEYHQHIIEDIIGLNDQLSLIDTKVDKVEGKSLVDNAQIVKLEGLKTQVEIDNAIGQAIIGEKGSVAIADAAPTVDGVYRAKESGTYPNLGGLVADPGYTTWFQKIGSTWSIYSKVSGASANGVIQLADTNAISGDTAYKAIAPLQAKISGGEFTVGDTDFTSYGTNLTQEYLFAAINNTIPQDGQIKKIRMPIHRAGDLVLYLLRFEEGGAQYRYKIISKQVVTAVVGNNTFVITGFNAELGDIIGFGFIAGGALGKTKNITPGQMVVNTISNPDQNVGAIITFSLSGRSLAFNYDIEVDSFESKINSFEPIIEDLELNSIKETDLKLEIIGNRFDPSKIVSGRYVSNTGSLASGVDWEIIYLDIENLPNDTPITISGLLVTKPGYFAFYDTNTVQPIMNLISSSNFSLPQFTVFKPAGAKGLAINIKRPADNSSAYEFGLINIGTEPIPYEPFNGEVVTEIKGYKLASSSSSGGGGEDYDQQLNTTNDVTFKSVTTPLAKVDVLEVTAWQANLPEGVGVPPIEVEVGDAWLDTTDNTIKVRRV